MLIILIMFLIYIRLYIVLNKLQKFWFEKLKTILPNYRFKNLIFNNSLFMYRINHLLLIILVYEDHNLLTNNNSKKKKKRETHFVANPKN